MKATILGCGTSSGVPVIRLGWGDCDPQEPRNRRRRASILVETDESILLVDTTPDLREQLIDAQVKRLDAVLYTHAHADHCHGIDDLRWICQFNGRPLPTYGAATHLDELRSRFEYVFTPIKGDFYYKPVLDPRDVDGPFRVGDIEVVPFEQDHGYSTTLGFRFGPIAYTTDAVRLDEAAFQALAGVDVWIVDCLQLSPHPTHAHLAKVLAWIARVRPRRAVLTHMNRNLDYRAVKDLLPAGVEPAYDGQVIEA